ASAATRARPLCFGRGSGKAGQRERRELVGDLAHRQAAAWVVPLVEPVQHPEHTVGDDLHIEVRPELAGFHAFTQDLLPAPFVLLRRELELLTEAALHLLPLMEVDEQVRVVLMERLELRVNGASELL